MEYTLAILFLESQKPTEQIGLIMVLESMWSLGPVFIKSLRIIKKNLKIWGKKIIC